MDGDMPRISAVHVRFTEDTSVQKGVRRVAEIWQAFRADQQDRPYANLLANVRVEDWITNRRAAIAPMEKEQTMLILLFLMLGIVTVFIIFVVFYMIVSHKSKDVGILKSVGISPVDIVQVFLIFAVLVGVIGAGLGAAAGCGFLAKINDVEGWLYEQYGFQLWNRDVYAIGEIPNTIEWQVLATVVLAAVGACLLGAIVPGIQAARRRPAQILQVSQL
jgi:lipoprotein-releasing system permease protein